MTPVMRRNEQTPPTQSKTAAAPAADCRVKSAYHHGNLRSALIGAGLEILVGEGVAALGLRSAARRAGVSQTAPYHHFGSKEGLLAAVAAAGFRQMASIQDQIVEGVRVEPSVPDLKVRMLGRTYVRFARENPELFRLMFGPLIDHRDQYPELIEAYTSGYQAIEDAIAEYLANAGLTGQLPLKVAISGAWAMVHGLSHLLNDGKIRPGEDGMPDEDELVDTLVAPLTRALAGIASSSREVNPASGTSFGTSSSADASGERESDTS